MAGKLNLYNLGTQGVDLTKSVIHADEGTLRHAQNAVPDPRGEFGGIAKRDGLGEINAMSIGGPVGGVVDAPLPAKARIYIGYDNTGDTGFLTSEDGFDSEPVFVPGQVVGLEASAWSVAGGQKRGCVVDNKFFYPPSLGITFTDSPPIWVLDGKVDREFARVPSEPVTGVQGPVLAMLPYRGTVYLITGAKDFQGSSSASGNAFTLNPITGEIRKLGSSSPDGRIPTCMVVSVGRLFVGTTYEAQTPTNGGRVYSVPVHGSNQFIQDVEVAHGDVSALEEHKGLVYAATGNDQSATGGQVYRRSEAGAWTAIKTLSSATASYTSLLSFGGNLYASYRDSNTQEAYVDEFDGTTWTTVLTNNSVPLPRMVLFKFGTRMFAVDGSGQAGGSLFYTDDGTTWTEVELIGATWPVFGVIGV